LNPVLMVSSIGLAERHVFTMARAPFSVRHSFLHCFFVAVIPFPVLGKSGSPVARLQHDGRPELPPRGSLPFERQTSPVSSKDLPG
jgi:hypothetical protein